MKRRNINLKRKKKEITKHFQLQAFYICAEVNVLQSVYKSQNNGIGITLKKEEESNDVK